MQQVHLLHVALGWSGDEAGGGGVEAGAGEGGGGGGRGAASSGRVAGIGRLVIAVSVGVCGCVGRLLCG